MDNMATVVLAGVVVVLLAAVAWLMLRLMAVTTEREQLRGQALAAQDQLAQQKGWVADQMQLVESKVTEATSKLVEERGRTLQAQHKVELDSLMGPLRTQLSDFRSRVDAIHTAETAERSKLHEQIVQLTNLNQQVTESANSLANALTISSKSTGTWGEMVLERILEQSGLRKDHEYKLQVSISADAGGRQQPDAVLYLPEDRQVVIDSKVSNKAWRDYCDASDDAARELAFKAHLLSLRQHIKGLEARNYTGSKDLNTVDFVLMFVPVEAALLSALTREPALYEDAWKSKIVLVTPTTLMAVVRLIQGMWVFEKRRKGSEEIAETGRKLYEKLVGFADSFVEIGDALKKSQLTYDKALGQLRTGPGNATKLAGKLLSLGVTPSTGKRLPSQVQPDDDEGDDAND